MTTFYTVIFYRSAYVRGNSEGAWGHDMFDGPRRGGVAQSSGPAKLVVSNLDFGVSNSEFETPQSPELK